MRSLRSRIKKIPKKPLKFIKEENHNRKSEICLSSIVSKTTVLDEEPITFTDLQKSSGGIGEKCGEVFRNKDEIFSYLCTICGTLLDGIEDFKIHVKSHNICKVEVLTDENLDLNHLEIDNNILSESIKEEKLSEDDEKPKKLRLKKIIKPKIKQTKKRKQEEFDQNTNNETAVIDITIKKEKDTNRDDDKKNENVTDTTKKPKKKRIRKKKHERSNVFCKLCNKEFICQLYLDSHLKYDHIARNPFVNSNVENQPDSWSDDDLDRQTKTQQTPNNHEKNEVIEELDKSISDDPFKCRYCDMRLKSRMNRYEHECLHTGEKPFKCETCGKTFRKKNVLDEHYITHTTEKPYKCEICNESYKHKKSLRIHIRRHNGEKPYKCKYCDKAYTNSVNRNTHERTHTNEKPFQCSDCGTCFGSNRRLLIHSRRKHSLSKPHVCSYCGKAYAEIIDKKQHEKIHQKGESYICKVCNAKFSTHKGFRTHIKTHPELINESNDQSPTVVPSNISNDMKNESNKSNEIATSSLSPSNIIENVNENQNQINNQNQNEIENGNDKIAPSWNVILPNAFGIFGLPFPQYPQSMVDQQ